MQDQPLQSVCVIQGVVPQQDSIPGDGLIHYRRRDTTNQVVTQIQGRQVRLLHDPDRASRDACIAQIQRA
ncbi:hypothetical protein D3C76_1621270 [compost metagenome]